MADADNMINITKSELQQFVGQYTSSISESKERMVRQHGSQSHRSRMEYCFIAQVAKTRMPVNDLHLFPDDDVSKNGEEGEYRGKGGFAIDDEEWDMIDFDAIGQVSDPCSICVCVCKDDNLVASVYQFLK